jgi:hypothetical protein
MTFNIDRIIIDLQMETDGLRLITESENLLLSNQTYEETKQTIEKNYKIVKDYFLPKINSIVILSDLEEVCLKIVLHYFYMYNLWREMYKREKNRDLTFLDKDFESISTADEIIYFFKHKYPDNYARKCEVLLNMTPDKFKDFEATRVLFFNK